MYSHFSRFFRSSGNPACLLLPFISFKLCLMLLFTHNVKRSKTSLTKKTRILTVSVNKGSLSFFVYKKFFFNKGVTRSLDSRYNDRLLLLLLLLTLNSGRLVAIQVLRTGK